MITSEIARFHNVMMHLHQFTAALIFLIAAGKLFSRNLIIFTNILRLKNPFLGYSAGKEYGPGYVGIGQYWLCFHSNTPYIFVLVIVSKMNPCKERAKKHPRVLTMCTMRFSAFIFLLFLLVSIRCVRESYTCRVHMRGSFWG